MLPSAASQGTESAQEGPGQGEADRTAEGTEASAMWDPHAGSGAAGSRRDGRVVIMGAHVHRALPRGMG